MIIATHHWKMNPSSNMDGAMTIAINKEEGQYFVGIAYCRPCDQFSKKTGRKIAIENARLAANDNSKNSVLVSDYGIILGFNMDINKLFEFNNDIAKYAEYELKDIHVEKIDNCTIFKYVIGFLKNFSALPAIPTWVKKIEIVNQ